MIAILLVLFGILAILVYILYGDQSHKDALQVFLSSLATTWLIVMIYPEPTITKNVLWTNIEPPIKPYIQATTIPPNVQSRTTGAPTGALSQAATDFEGIIKWGKARKNEFSLVDSSISPPHFGRLGHQQFKTKIINHSNHIIAGLEFEMLINDCLVFSGRRSKCLRVTKLVHETVIGDVIRPGNTHLLSFFLPFQGSMNDYKVDVKLKRVAYWQGPELRHDTIAISPSSSKGYIEIARADVDTSATCTLPAGGNMSSAGC